MLDCAGDPLWLHGPRNPIAAAAAPLQRALVRVGGPGMSSSSLPTPLWPLHVLIDLVEKFLLLGCLSRCILEIFARFLFRGSQARS